MDLHLLLCAPHVRPSALATALHHPPGRVADATWDLSAILCRLAEETERSVRLPARPWARPEPPPWVEATLTDFAPALLDARFPSAQRVVLLHPALASRFSLLRRWLPAARWTVLLRDGLIPATQLPARLTPEQAAVAGLRWAEQWAASVVPALEAGVPAFSVDPVGADLAARLECPRLAGWRPPPPSVPLEGLAAQGFACHGPARRAMAHLGVALPTPTDALLHAVPALAAAVAEDLLAHGAPEPAHVLLLRAVQHHPEDALLWATLGALHAAEGDEDSAVRHWCQALRRPQPPLWVWQRLLALAHRDETLVFIAAARTAAVPEIRDAAARWLVARGLDQEAAEALAQVHGRRWYIAPPGVAAAPAVEDEAAA